MAPVLKRSMVQRLGKPRSHEGWLILTGSAILLGVLLLTALAPLFAPYDPTSATLLLKGERVILPPLQPPGTRYRVEVAGETFEFFFPLGTNQNGHDIFSRIIYGARFVLIVSLFSTLLSMAVGIPLGLFSGYVGGMVDRGLSLVMDSMYAFPGLVLAIAIAALLGPGVFNMAIAIAVVYIPSYFRIIRGQVLSLREQTFVEAARALGAGHLDILRLYILPNVLPSVMVVSTLNIADAIITEAGLSFLGLGITPPTPDWGLDLNDGKRYYLSGAWWLGVFPGLMIVVTVLGFSLLGEGLNERFNPKLRAA